MKKTGVVIVDDDPMAISELKQFLHRLGCVVLGTYTEARTAIQQLPQLNPGLMLLDMSLNGELNGIETARLAKAVCSVPVVYVAGELNPSLVEEARTAKAHGFVTRPLDEHQLEMAIDIALEQHSKEQNLLREREQYLSLLEKRDERSYIFVRTDYKLQRIELEDICYVEALKDYVLINTFSGVYTTHTSMKEMMRILPENEFMRIHRSFIVRINKIANIKYPELVIEGKMTVLPIGGIYKKDVFRRLQVLK
jgi:DNA-binding LytR/AlgR family response regulator